MNSKNLRDRQAAEFDEFGPDYRERLERSIGGMASVDSALKSKLHILRKLTGDNSRISEGLALDFGCGTGLLTGRLNQLARQTLGVDVSLVSLKQGNDSDSAFVQFDGISLPLRQNSVDLVVASCVFHHIPAAARPAILSEIRRVLKPHGLLVIIEHNPYNPVTRFVVNRCEFDRDAELISLSKARKLSGNAGLQDFRSGYFYAVPPNGRLLATFDEWLAVFPFGAQYFCAMSKPAQ